MHNCLRWVSREEGIFRIINTDLLARMWGRRHGNPCMTYEKLARAMRLALSIYFFFMSKGPLAELAEMY